MKDIRIIVAHPFQQHSYKLASALEQKGYLLSYYTTVYDREKSFTGFVKKIVKGKLANRIAKKKCDQIDCKVKTFCEISGIVYLAMIRFPQIEKLRRAFGTGLTRRFGIKVAKAAIKSNADAVVMYDTTADSCFLYLKKHAPQIRRILDMSSNAAEHRLSIYESEVERDYITYLKEENPIIWNRKATESNTSEILNADYYLVASEFVKKSLEYVGADTKNAILLRYGVDNREFDNDGVERKPGFSSRTLQLVYTGSVTYSKGLHHLFNVVSQYTKDQVYLKICGRVTNESRLYNEYKDKDNISFAGFVTHSELKSIYNECDFFIMPSLAEGFSLSILEAMSCGLPIIVSDNTGYEILVREADIGYCFESGREDILKQILDTIRHDSSNYVLQSINAKKMASKLSWAYYMDNAQSVFEKIQYNEVN